MDEVRPGASGYWRFKGERVWHYGYVTVVGSGLVRMGWYHGDTIHGPIVDPKEIEWREKR